jgi:hypothetical protein
MSQETVAPKRRAAAQQAPAVVQKTAPGADGQPVGSDPVGEPWALSSNPVEIEAQAEERTQEQAAVDARTQAEEQARAAAQSARKLRQADRARRREAARAAAAAQARAAERAKSAREYQQYKQYKSELEFQLNTAITDMGYMPPQPPPLLSARALALVVHEHEAYKSDPVFSVALAMVRQDVERQCTHSYEYLTRIKKSLKTSPSISKIINPMFHRTHSSIDRATVSIGIPSVSEDLIEKMRDIELFLAEDEWTKEQHRGVVAIHVDKARKSTILQIGMMPHGPIYITIPAILRPEDMAERSIGVLLKRLAPFHDTVDPMAVINGAHQGLVYNKLFHKSRAIVKPRIIRAPSGNMARLADNLRECARRERLSVENTTILNSAPRDREACRRVFQGRDLWHAWRGEASEWDNTVAAAEFARSQLQEASRDSLLLALAREENVIVIVAHCEDGKDGQRIFMPDPAPTGSVVTRDDLLANREQIAANAPFVYLFSCEAGDISSLHNIASTLLECGAAGVVASQSGVDGIGERPLLQRLLADKRDAPPIEDFYKAIREVEYLNMEVYLA